MIAKSCTLNFALDNAGLAVVGPSRRCRYHRRRQDFSSAMIFPDKLCPSAFGILYPYCLSMLSRAKFPIENGKEVCRVSCPGMPSQVEFNIFRRPYKKRAFGKIAFYFKKILNFFMPVELLEHKVYIEVVKGSDGCPFSYNKGRIFEFNIGDKKEICPAALYSLYPFYLAFLDKNRHLEGHRQAGNLSCRMSCPDYRANIAFNLGSRAKDSADANKHFFAKCDEYNHIYVKIAAAGNVGNSSVKEGLEYSIDQLIESLGIPCYTAFYNLFPYMLSLERGASLGFLTFDRNAAGIQCPNPAARLRLLLKKDVKRNSYFMNALGQRGICPKGIIKGRSYKLPGFLNNKFDISALASLFPYIMQLRSSLNSEKTYELYYSCDSYCAKFLIYKKEGNNAY